MSSDWFDARGLYDWLAGKGLTSDLADDEYVGRALRRWKAGGVANVYKADRVLVALDVVLSEVPEELYCDPPVIRRRATSEIARLRDEGIRMLAEGYWPGEVARLLGVSRRSVGRWQKELQDDIG